MEILVFTLNAVVLAEYILTHQIGFKCIYFTLAGTLGFNEREVIKYAYHKRARMFYGCTAVKLDATGQRCIGALAVNAIGEAALSRKS